MISWPAQQPTLTEDEITLRPTRHDDAPHMWRYISNDAEIRQFTRVPSPYEEHHSVEAIDGWQRDFEAEEVLQFAVTLADGPIVGQVTLFAINQHDHTAELGYLLAASARGNAVMARSVELLVDYAFAIGFRKIYAYTHPLNVASIKTLLNAGFEKEAVLKKHMTRRDGVQDDALMFSKWDESEVVR